MNGMYFRQLPPPSASAAASPLDGLVARLLGAFIWLTLMALGAVFALSLLVWLAVMVVTSLIASVFTGRPAAVTVLWRRYREMTRQRWPQQHPGSATPRADAADVTGASVPTRVQDVHWREVPAAPKAPAPRQQP